MTTASAVHRPSWWGLIPFAVAVTVAALIGGLGVAGTPAEYQNLNQPSWAPPSWLFGAIWTPIFFGFGRYGLALVDIAVLWVLISATIWLFRPVTRTAAGLLVPYWAWVTFATALNAAIWHAN